MTALIAVLLASCGFTQYPILASAGQPDTTVTVVGMHSESFEADWLEFKTSMGLKGRFNSQIVDRLKSRFNDFRIELHAICDSGLRVYTDPADHWMKSRNCDYKNIGAVLSITVELNDLDKYADILGFLRTNDQLGNVKIKAHLDEDSTKQASTLEGAWADARFQAEVIAKSCGIELGDVVEVDVNPSHDELSRRTYAHHSDNNSGSPYYNPRSFEFNRGVPAVILTSAVMIKYAIR